MQIVIMPAIVEIVLEPATDLEAPVGSNRYIPEIEQPMDVSSKQEAIGRDVLAPGCVRPDVSRIEDGQRLLAAHSAAAVVVVHHGEPKGALSKTRLDENGRTVARLQRNK